MSWAGKIKNVLIVNLATLLIRIWCLTIRLKFEQPELKDRLLAKKEPALLFFWHRHLFYLLDFFRGSSFRPLISLSGDGELIARIAEKFGLRPVRGSSSRGGAAALLQILRLLKRERETILITADGPRGPARVIKPGVMKIVAQEKTRVYPVSWYGSRVKVFEKSWDKFLLPFPFSTVYLRIGPELDGSISAIDGEAAGQQLNILENECISYFSSVNRGERQ